MGRAYKLYAVSTTTVNAAASVRVTKNCRIRCINVSLVGLAGAAIDGYLIDEVSKQNVSSYNVNDTPETVLATIGCPCPVNAGTYGVNASFVCDLPAAVGDTIYLNIVKGGTTPTSCNHIVTIFTD